MALGLSKISFSAVPRQASEYNIKAVFLYNFANFITWPKEAFAQKNTSFYICILGQDPFGKAIDVTVENQLIQGRSLEVRRLNRDKRELYACHILFISQSERNHLQEIFRKIRPFSILTVSDIEDFINQGGMIRFFNRNKKVRLAINPHALRSVKLKADANLLDLSLIESP